MKKYIVAVLIAVFAISSSLPAMAAAGDGKPANAVKLVVNVEPYTVNGKKFEPPKDYFAKMVEEANKAIKNKVIDAGYVIDDNADKVLAWHITQNHSAFSMIFYNNSVHDADLVLTLCDNSKNVLFTQKTDARKSSQVAIGKTQDVGIATVLAVIDKVDLPRPAQ